MQICAFSHYRNLKRIEIFIYCKLGFKKNLLGPIIEVLQNQLKSNLVKVQLKKSQ